MMEFEERGGFCQVLKDIFNPSDLAAMELDSVFQLKNLCKDFYRKKQLLSGGLVQTLDALSNERPVVLQMKRRHFNIDGSGNSHMQESLEWMRINAERERIQRFKTIAKDSATCYYKVMDRFTKSLLESGKQKGGPSRAADPCSQNGEADGEESPKAASTRQKYDFKHVMNAAYKENQLHNVIRYMTDYLRQVIENGSRFTSGHFFIMLLQLSAKEIENQAHEYLKIFVDEIKVPAEQYAKFVAGLRDEELKTAYANIQAYLFEESQ